jgi:hypothetical protein
MPQRPRQHELDTEAIDYIRNKLPTRWTREEIKNDYGKDLFVEIFENGEATALEFRIQSKGHEHFVIRHKDQVIQQLEVSKLNYYEQLPLPVLLVSYSSQKKQARYLWIKPYIHQVLDKERPHWRELSGDSKVSIRIPLSNVFDELSYEDILRHVETEIVKIRGLGTGDYQFTDRQKASYRELITSTRLIRPKITHYLHRSRLTDAVNAALAQCSVFIQADAGYGKTWLLLDFFNTTKPSVSIWYSFTKDPLDALRFIEEVASELARQTNQIGLETLRLIQSKGKDIKSDEALAVLVTEVASAPNTSMLLVLEDIHNANDAVYSAIYSLLLSTPKNLQIILTSRLPLPTNQARLVAQGQLTIFERSKLEFTLDETCDYLKSVAGADLSIGQMKLLHERTGGWIAAVGLAIEVLHNSSIQSNELFARLTGFDGNIYDFFAEEVYKGLPPETQSLLKRLGVARSIRPEVVNLFTGRTDGGQILKDLSKNNTFLTENQEIDRYYQFHALFSEFLQTRFRDEEGLESVRQAHKILADYYSSHREWYFAVEHAIDAEEWSLVVQCLGIIGPIGVSLGYGQAFLEWSERIPNVFLNGSASLCELVGLSSVQVGNLDDASRAFDKAKSFYTTQQDLGALNRLEFYIAEIDLDRGVISPEDFLRIAHRVSLWSYQHNDVLFGTQVELRLIQVGQTLALKYGNLLRQLIERSETLIVKIETLGAEYEIIKAKVLSSQAHLTFQVVSFTFQQQAGRIHLREKLGHPIAMEERISHARMVMDGIQLVWGLYDEAEKITKEKNEIEWAIIRSSHLNDFAHHLSQVFFMRLVQATETPPQKPDFDIQTRKLLFEILVEFDHCVQIFEKYRQMHALAKSLCDEADIYDILGDVSNRDRLAKQALEIASNKNFVELKNRSQDLLLNQNTLTSLREKAASEVGDRELADLDEKGKADYVTTISRAFAGNVDIEKIREAITSDVDDMVASAEQRLDWCRHVEIIQDLSHTKSLETMYREIPQKRIVCMELGHKSPTPGLSFDKLWPMFRGVYCLGCTSRSLEK